ncbi:MAG: cation diffusion facilitator family transporter [Spirochaetes bacterium]|nr:cation diffusion facilitator family transporter [Spirochaetota bacterium]
MSAGHDPSHGSVPITEETTGGKFVLSILVTSLTLVAETVGGILTGSLALLSDAAHVFLDILALALSYGAVRLASRAPSEKHTYGFHRMKVIAAFINGATLVIVAIEIFREAIKRFGHPEPVIAGPMLIVAVIGLAANLIVALVLGHHEHDDLNTRAAFLHVLGDALSSVGVMAAGFIILFTGWTWVDPAVGILIGVIILSGAWRVLKEATHILNEGAPDDASVGDVSSAMAAVEGVLEVHDVHVWTVGPGYKVLSAHVLVSDLALSETEAIMREMKEVLAHRFGLEHTTIQFECANCGQCSGASCAEGKIT